MLGIPYGFLIIAVFTAKIIVVDAFSISNRYIQGIAIRFVVLERLGMNLR